MHTTYNIRGTTTLKPPRISKLKLAALAFTLVFVAIGAISVIKTVYAFNSFIAGALTVVLMVLAPLAVMIAVDKHL